MRLFLIWADEYEKIAKLILALQAKGHKILYWVGWGDGEGKIPGAVFHEHNDAWEGIPAEGVNINEFPPPGQNLIERFYKTESLILTMMNKKFDRKCVDERRHIYYNMLRYWYGVLKKYKPDVIIFPVIPHTVYNFILYQLAKYLRIKTLMFNVLELPDRLPFYTDWSKGDIALQKELQKNQEKNFSLNELSLDIQEYYRRRRKNGPEAAPRKMIYISKQLSRRKALMHKFGVIGFCLKKHIFLKKATEYIIKKFQPNLKKEHTTVQTRPDFSKHFVYVPLNFQPECTTSPQGDMFADQILMIETLSYALPDNWLIYVKEHPGQWWRRGGRAGIQYSSNRYPGYYRRVAKIKNVRLVPIDTETFTLINKSQVVATVTGTAGWEALMRSKPVLIFGKPWYHDCPALFKVDNVDSCKEAFRKIIQGFRPDQQQIINYLKCFDNVSTKGYFAPPIGRESKFTEQESEHNIIQKILYELARG